jgi:hypothetical protein
MSSPSILLRRTSLICSLLCLSGSYVKGDLDWFCLSSMLQVLGSKMSNVFEVGRQRMCSRKGRTAADVIM